MKGLGFRSSGKRSNWKVFRLRTFCPSTSQQCKYDRPNGADVAEEMEPFIRRCFEICYDLYERPAIRSCQRRSGGGNNPARPDSPYDLGESTRTNAARVNVVSELPSSFKFQPQSNKRPQRYHRRDSRERKCAHWRIISSTRLSTS